MFCWRPNTRSNRGFSFQLAGNVVLSAMFLLAFLAPSQFGHARSKSKPPEVDWIEMRNGALVYGTDQYGNRIPDFSAAGYGGGGVPIPDLPERASLDAIPSGDDTPRIQAAIDALAKQPVDTAGFRGALVLHKGTYRIAGTILLNASGIVLRGGGTDHDTLLVALGEPHTLIRIGGNGERQRVGQEIAVADNYVPVGADSATVEDVRELHAGDRIIVEWKMTAAWIHAVGMDRLPPRRDGRAITQSQPGMALRFDRRILAINGKKLTLDAPLTNAMARADGATVWRYAFPGRIEQAGVTCAAMVWRLRSLTVFPTRTI